MNRAEPEDLEDTCHLDEKKKIVRVDDKFTHKPTMKVDEAKKAVEVTYPYLETGKDEYVETLSLQQRDDLLGGVHDHDVQQGAGAAAR